VTTRNCQVMPAAYALPLPGEHIPQWFRLGSLCHKGHDWDGTGRSLRYAKTRGACVVCARAGAIERQERRKQADPDFRAKAAAWIREKRQREGRPYRGKHSPEWHQQRRDAAVLRKALEAARLSPSVAQLVYQQQLGYWRDHPEARLAYNRALSRWRWAWRYKVDPAYNAHERQRNSERKARNRGNHTIRLRPADVAHRFEQFNNRCCYCGSDQSIQVEHFIPRSQGGPHVINNLLPACTECNKSKRDHDPEAWYRAQSFFSERRWSKIRRVLGLARGSVAQLPLL
jgi:5-methylcytosine-specific restriction endonuclease McrA